MYVVVNMYVVNMYVVVKMLLNIFHEVLSPLKLSGSAVLRTSPGTV